jgi:hypothetical protein
LRNGQELSLPSGLEYRKRAPWRIARRTPRIRIDRIRPKLERRNLTTQAVAVVGKFQRSRPTGKQPLSGTARIGEDRAGEGSPTTLDCWGDADRNHYRRYLELETGSPMQMCKIHHLVLVTLLVLEPSVHHAGLDAAEGEGAASATGPPLPRYAPGLGFLHPLPSSEADVTRLCRSLPQQRKAHVYIFLINGVDPLYLANLNGLCAYLRALGFVQAEVGQMTAMATFRDRIRQIRSSDREARIALVGFSAGAYCAQSIVQTLKNENIPIDLLVYLGADMIREGDHSQPANVQRIVNITGHGFLLSGYDLFFNGTALPGARNVRLPARHFALPSRPETLRIVVEELVALSYPDPADLNDPPQAAVRTRNSP